MKTNEIRVGAFYAAKVSGNVVVVRVDKVNEHEGTKYSRARTGFSCTNMKSGRTVAIKTAMKFRYECDQEGHRLRKSSVIAEAQKLLARRASNQAAIENAHKVSSEGKKEAGYVVENGGAVAPGTICKCNEGGFCPMHGKKPAPAPAKLNGKKLVKICDDCCCAPCECQAEGEKSVDPTPAAVTAGETAGDTTSAQTIAPAATTTIFGKGDLVIKGNDETVWRIAEVDGCLANLEHNERKFNMVHTNHLRKATPVEIAFSKLQPVADEEPKKPGIGKLALDALRRKGAPIVPAEDETILRDPEKLADFPAGAVEPEVVPPGKPQGGFAAKLLAHRQAKPLPPHIMIKALAGCGKTTTLIEGMKPVFGLPLPPGLVPSPQQKAIWEQMLLGGRPRLSCFSSFGNAITQTLADRIPKGVGCAARTLHSLGYYAVKKAFRINKDPDDGRTYEIISELLGMDVRQLRADAPVMMKATKQLVALCKQNLTDLKGDAASELSKLAYHYDVELGRFREDVFALVPAVMDRAKDVNRDGYVDFNDMVWLPIVHKLPIFSNDLLLVDEFQDLNRCQHAIARQAGMRLICCGDPNQSIYGFAGAANEGMDQVKAQLGMDARGCIELPLTVTRRCGKAIVREAQAIVPEFEAHPDNPEGIVREAKYPIQKRLEAGRTVGYELPYDQTYLPQVQDGDMVLCRANAPLVNQCFRFLAQKRKAFIQGRNVADSLVALVESLEADKAVDLLKKLADWEKRETDRENANRAPSETKLQSIQDRAACLRSFCTAPGVHTSEDVIKCIDSIFTDDKASPGIKLSSIHRAKGMEAHRVFYIQGFSRPEERMRPWEIQQERNLRYVAITRAIEELVYVY